MWKLFLLSAVCLCVPFVSSWRGLLLGPGQWLVLNTALCDNLEESEFDFQIFRKKINRTHDCFDIYVEFPRIFDNTFAVTIDAYQLVDGGFKYFQTFADDCACGFLMKHAEDNMIRALTLANVDPPRCPIQPGKVRVENFVMDYRELPRNGVYGTFGALVYFTYEGKKVSCVKITVNFDQRKPDDSAEDDVDYDVL